ncbi:hypothetical protein [Rhizosphaericola mali]|nr:hypothetical protein [Rhizosphaericola mali]
MTLEQFKEKNFGQKGTAKRDALERGYKGFVQWVLKRNSQIGKKKS